VIVEVDVLLLHPAPRGLPAGFHHKRANTNGKMESSAVHFQRRGDISTCAMMHLATGFFILL
jgi:hypothetical protein